MYINTNIPINKNSLKSIKTSKERFKQILFSDIFRFLFINEDRSEKWNYINYVDDMIKTDKCRDSKDLVEQILYEIVNARYGAQFHSVWSDKIEFDRENVNINEIDGELLGFHTLENGFSFLGLLMGGDWEVDIFGILYFDGEKIQGYLPLLGNSYNRTSKSVFGNDEESDRDFLLEELNIDINLSGKDIWEIVDINWELIKQDIIQTIYIEDKTLE